MMAQVQLIKKLKGNYLPILIGDGAVEVQERHQGQAACVCSLRVEAGQNPELLQELLTRGRGTGWITWW